jgi:drug/metabolite transporter (DMT)-like permease
MVLNSAAGLLQSDAIRRMGRHDRLLTQRRYLGGLFVDGLGWAATVVAARNLPVFAVQAVLGGSIAVTAIAARIIYGSTLRPVDRAAIGACLVGLALVAGSAGAEQPSPASVTAYVVLAAATAALAVATAVLWRGRTWPLAVIAGLGFGGTSLAVRAVHVQAGHSFGLLDLLTQPAAYLLVCLWAIGMISYTRALALGNLAQVTAVFQVTEVIVPGLVGIALLDDSVRSGWQPAMAVGLLVATAGVAVLTRSPVHQPQRPPRLTADR